MRGVDCDLSHVLAATVVGGGAGGLLGAMIGALLPADDSEGGVR